MLKSIGLRSYYVVFKCFIGVSLILVLSSCNSETPTEEEWSVAMSTLADNLGTGVFRSLGVEYDSTKVDFLVTNDKWFVALAASYGDRAGAYQLYVGRLHNNSLFFKNMSPIKKLDSLELKDYEILAETGRLRELVGEEGFWKKEKNFQKIWECALHHNMNGSFTESGAGFRKIRIKK